MLRIIILLLLCVAVITGGLWYMAKKKKRPVPVAQANPRILFETNKGAFTVELFSDVPATTQNFINLVSSGFYNGLTFHRYVPGFVIQGGDPTGTGTGGSGKTIPLEITEHKHVLGALGMARSSDPNSASCQFYICLAPQPSLDGGYAVFGQVVDGMDNVYQLRQGDQMSSVKLLPSTP